MRNTTLLIVMVILLLTGPLIKVGGWSKPPPTNIVELVMYYLQISGHADIIRLLINAGADMHIADNCGSTPLHLACIYGHLNCVRMLCELVCL